MKIETDAIIINLPDMVMGTPFTRHKIEIVFERDHADKPYNVQVIQNKIILHESNLTTFLKRNPKATIPATKINEFTLQIPFILLTTK